MQTIHKIACASSYALTDELTRVAQGFRRHAREYNAINEDVDSETLRELNLDRAYLALTVLGRFFPNETVYSVEGDDTVVYNHLPFQRSYLFLAKCGFDDETINEVGIAVESPYGTN